MDRRLERIFSYIEDGLGVLDVGTDHGYLPVALYRRGYPGNLIAADIHEDPLRKAIQHAKEAGAAEKIQFLLCDGLQDCDPKAMDVIVIAGMGGDTIAGILQRAPWCKDPAYRFYLQPMSKADVLRRWLSGEGFCIEKEDLVLEGQTLYQILSVRYAVSAPLSAAECYLGRRSVHQDLALYEMHRQQLIQRFERAIDGMKLAENRDMQKKIQESRMLLEEMRKGS